MPRWQDALLAYLGPDADDGAIVYGDEDVVVVADKYPKARVHLLVVARDTSLGSVLDLRSTHVGLLEHMRDVGGREAARWVEGGGTTTTTTTTTTTRGQTRTELRLQMVGIVVVLGALSALSGSLRSPFTPRGYPTPLSALVVVHPGSHLTPPTINQGFHAKPSLRPLHMHVVSRDLEKAKTKKHYLSFADPGFFLDVGWVCSELRARGRVAYDVADKERILKETGVEDWKGERARRGRGVEEGGGRTNE